MCACRLSVNSIWWYYKQRGSNDKRRQAMANDQETKQCKQKTKFRFMITITVHFCLEHGTQRQNQQQQQQQQKVMITFLDSRLSTSDGSQCTVSTHSAHATQFQIQQKQFFYQSFSFSFFFFIRFTPLRTDSAEYIGHTIYIIILSATAEPVTVCVCVCHIDISCAMLSVQHFVEREMKWK